MIKVYNKAILPIGFTASAVASGIKKNNKLDLALFYSSLPAKAGAKFTTNQIQAAPVVVCKNNFRKAKSFQAIIVNSGNANCFTGKRGLSVAEQTLTVLAKELAINKESIFIASTGMIAKKMPFEKIKRAIPSLVKELDSENIDKACKAIITTDTFTKKVTVKYKLDGKIITICGVAKGAGMIAPDMATMLSFIFTDANIQVKALREALTRAVEGSFNCITVDGCMSTNDTLILMANGAAKNNQISLKKNFSGFSAVLKTACLGLAKMMVKDGEGATKFIQINVHQAKDYQQAKKAGLAIANSNLFKTAVFAQSSNFFGRLVAAIGASKVKVSENRLKVKASPLNKKEITIEVYLGTGLASATVFTSDLTYEYIKINAEYS